MDITPEAIHDVEFREAKKGYNTQEVDDFLEKVAVDLGRAQAQARESRQRVEAAEARIAELERHAAEADRRASELSDADETLKRTLVLAQRTADAAIKEAEEQASRTLTAAQEQSNRMLADAQEAATQARIQAENDARRAQEETQVAVLAELRTLEDARERLRADADALERYLDAQRERLRVSVRDLQRVLDDPDALRPVAQPEISEVELPEPPQPPDAEAAAERSPVAERPLTAPPDPGGEGGESGTAAGDELGTVAADEPRRGRAAPAAEADPGPPTEPVDMLADRDADDDAYLAELRKAMTDDSPLGPREDEGDDTGARFEDEADRSARSRFGRRR